MALEKFSVVPQSAAEDMKNNYPGGVFLQRVIKELSFSFSPKGCIQLGSES